MSEILTESIEQYRLSESTTPRMKFSKVGIVGCGSTGQSITLMIASRGIEVVFLELTQELIDEAFSEMQERLDEKINHWGLTKNDEKLILSRIKGSLDYKDLKGCDIVIESILSKTREFSKDIRQAIFKQIEEHVERNTIIATNSTSSVITELASELKYKDRCVSLHFSTTSPDAQIVEVVMGLYSSEEVSINIQKFAKLINKTPVHVEESPGLISVRLGVSIIAEACDLLMEGVGSKEDIDFVMKKGLGMSLGPFEMADKIGLERVVRWMDNLYNEFGDRKYKPSPIIKKLVRAKRYGRKTCEGFYKYDELGYKLKDQYKEVNCSNIF
ncbi:MAG: 3-hydroxyacyl-CoA dehydrogenase NAD-binding domain-containing protein [Bacteroidales bacterium]|nr:3-hydroxyacyl-CoA dehydrogenase NAD-binding domain-containing protein [Bacteroidales bacterium]